MPEREALLLVSKLRVPPWRADWVARPRLLDPAAQPARARLLLCAAPAGFGKTTALIGWAARQREAEAAVAWYTLDDSDNDPARFTAYLVGALAQADPQLALADLTRHAGADREQLLVGLLNLLDATCRPYALVLDDYHLISAPAVHQLVATLLDHLPDTVQLAIGTRADPPLPLARLRVRGQLAELRAADLQFTPAEIAAFFRRGAPDALPVAALERLGDWSEGWAAGLQLLALALAPAQAGVTALDQLQAHFTGSQRHIFSFLADEVFAKQPPDVQAFLLATSVVDDLTPELCDALVKDEGGRMKDEVPGGGGGVVDTFILHPSSFILEQLERANLFLVRLDATRPWYRYHHLFRSFLRRRLDAELPGLRVQLHRRAARWHAATGDLALAANHALAGDDMGLAADLIVRLAWEQFSAHGEITSILSWAERFPAAQLAASPLLSLSFGQAALMAEQAAAATHYFALAEQGIARIAADPAGAATQIKFRFYQALALTMDGAIGRAQELLDTMAPLLPRPEDDPGAVAAHTLVGGACALLRGELPAAYVQLERTAQLASQASHIHFIVEATQLLALTDLTAGRLEQAERRCTALLDRLGDALPPIPALGLMLGWLGEVAYQRGQLERAEALLRQGVQQSRRSSGQTAGQVWYWLVRVLAARGDDASLRALLAEAGGRPDPARGAVLTAVILAARAEGLLALGATDEAWRWAEHCMQVPGEQLREVEVLCVARALLALGRPAEALARLEPFIAAAERGGWHGRLIEPLVLQAQALATLGRPHEARAALGRARALAEPAGYVQVFARMKDEGGRMKQVAADRDLHPSSFMSHPLAEPLTARELEVLALLAQGATNQDIAAALVVSVGTVKTHLNHIFDKLAARNRTEAVVRARILGLL